MINPYTAKGNTKMLPSLVCFADILGFSQLSIENIKKGNGDLFLDKIRDCLNKAYEKIIAQIIPHKDVADFNLKVFTDNLVIGFPFVDFAFESGEPELGVLLQVISEFQVNLAMEGFFIRGAISLGRHYMDENIVFGDALIEAHNLETLGGPPRIILSNNMKDLVKKQIGFYKDVTDSPHFSELLQDADGEIFVNYLDQAFEIFPEGNIFFEVLENHKLRVEENLANYSDNPHIHEKYEWISRYHNFICKEVAEIFQPKSDPDQDPEYAMASESAQKTLKYLIQNFEGLTPSRINFTS